MNLLRTQVVGGTNGGSVGGEAHAVGGDRDAEVDQLRHLEVCSRCPWDEYVGRLDVAVDDSAIVDVRERPGQGGAEPCDLVLGQGRLPDCVGQGAAVDKLGNQVSRAVRGRGVAHFGVEYGDQPGGVQFEQNLGLATVALVGVDQIGSGPEYLDRHVSPCAVVTRAVHG